MIANHRVDAGGLACDNFRPSHRPTSTFFGLLGLVRVDRLVACIAERMLL
jgi:hypothetical protein